MDVRVVFNLRLDDLRSHADRLTLDASEARRILVHDRTVQEPEGGHRSVYGDEVHLVCGGVRERLHVPPLDAARDREADVWVGGNNERARIDATKPA
jgi:hypothetical protein